MKYLKSLSLCFAILIFMTSCSRSSFTNDRSCEEICTTITAAIDDQQYMQFDSTHLNVYFEDNSKYDDYYIVYSESTNDINEFGIFHATDKETSNELYDSCLEYIQELQENSRAFIASYSPNELNKLDNAQVRKFGNYVVYTVLSEYSAQLVFNQVEKLLVK